MHISQTKKPQFFFIIINQNEFICLGAFGIVTLATLLFQFVQQQQQQPIYCCRIDWACSVCSRSEVNSCACVFVQVQQVISCFVSQLRFHFKAHTKKKLWKKIEHRCGRVHKVCLFISFQLFFSRHFFPCGCQPKVKYPFGGIGVSAVPFDLVLSNTKIKIVCHYCFEF